MSPGRQQHLGGLGIIQSGHHHHGALGALFQLARGHHQVDHHVAVGLAHPDHRGGGEHVEDQLGGGAGLHAGGAHHHLGTDHRADGHIDPHIDLLAGIAGDVKGPGPDLLRFFDGAEHIRGAVAGGDAADHILGAAAPFHQVQRALLPLVLAAFLGAGEGLLPPGDNPLHHFRIGAESGGTFRCIQHPQPPAGAGADIKQPPAVLEGLHQEVHRLGNIGDLRLHDPGNGMILAVNDAQDLLAVQVVDVLRGRIAHLGDQLLQFFEYTVGHGDSKGVMMYGGFVELRMGHGAWGNNLLPRNFLGFFLLSS